MSTSRGKASSESDEGDIVCKNLGSELNNMSIGTPLRRGKRVRKQKTYSEFVDNGKHIRKKDDISSDSDPNEEETNTLRKSNALFTSEDIEGQSMFKFKATHSKNDLMNKVCETVQNSPKLNKTPLSTPCKSLLKQTSEATPKHLREILRKKIIKKIESDESDGDFSESSSDFVPDHDSTPSDSSSGSPEDDEQREKVAPKHLLRQPLKKRPNRTRNVKCDPDFIVKSDDYFSMHSGKKIVTSDHTLERLKNNNINDTDLSEVKIDDFVSEEHKRCLRELNSSYEQLFDRWVYALEENFSVLLYGLGSKRAVLQKFQAERLNHTPVIVINGFFPSLTMRNILECIMIDLLEYSQVPSNVYECIQLIDARLIEFKLKIFLIVHNIDGPMLHGSKTQNALATLSALENVHFIATIDHINAPLVWDHTKQSKFKFTWWDVTTLLPYTAETSYENSILSRRPGALQLSSLRSVYLSLTSNSKGIFNIIIKYQLENSKTPHYQGLPFKDLYAMSREQFLVSSDIALRAQLTEFLDHKLVKMKRSIDGSDNLIIPIDNLLLQQFIEQQEQ